MQSTLIFVAGLFAAAGSDQGNISQHLVPYEKRFYGQGNISPHSVPFKKRSDWGHISPHCVFFKISFQTSEIDWGNISPHLMSFKKSFMTSEIVFNKVLQLFTFPASSN